MATVTHIDHEREQMLERRKRFIGGSDAASLFPEESKYGCPRRLVYDKRGIKPDYERTEREKRLLERGLEMEDMIADKFSRDFGFKIRRTPTFVNRDKPFIGVNMDRQIVNVTTEEIQLFWPEIQLEGQCGPGYLECKSDEYGFRKLSSEGVIPDYVFQVQHGIGARGYRWGVMAIMQPSSFDMRVFPFTAHTSLIGVMQQKAGELWEYVTDPTKPLPAIPKFPDGHTRCRGCIYRRTCLGEAALLQMAGEPMESVYVSDDSFSEVLTDYRDITQQIAALETVQEQIKKSIQERMTAKEYTKLEVPSIGMRVNWTQQKAPMKWDTRGLEAEGPTIGRHVHFAEWASEQKPEMLAEFQKRFPTSVSIAEKYKHPGVATRPFKVTQL